MSGFDTLCPLPQGFLTNSSPLVSPRTTSSPLVSPRTAPGSSNTTQQTQLDCTIDTFSNNRNSSISTSSVSPVNPPPPASNTSIGAGGGSAHNSPVFALRTPPVEDNGLNSTMARMFSSGIGATGSRGTSATNSPAWSPNASPSLDDGLGIHVIASGDSVASRIEQERRRARGSIYAQRSRDNSKAQAIRLRLQAEVQQLQASNAQLDLSLAQYSGFQSGAQPSHLPS